MAESTEWLSKKLFFNSFLSVTSQKTLVSKESDSDCNELKFLRNSPVSNIKAQRKLWAFMAESTGLEPVHPYRDDGLAIRCITTLPTLHVVLEYMYIMFSTTSIFFFKFYHIEDIM